MSKMAFVSLVMVALVAALLFGCALMSQQPKMQVYENNTSVIVVNQSTGANETVAPPQQEPPKNETAQITSQTGKTVKASIGFSSIASAPIGAGLSSLNVTIGKVEFRGQNGWKTIISGATVVDLVTANGKRAETSEIQVPVDSYDRLRIVVIKADAASTTNTVIPGVVSQLKTVQLSIPSQEKEAEVLFHPSESNGAYSLTVVFDINSMKPETMDTFEPALSMRANTITECKESCTSGCRMEGIYTECVSACVRDQNRTCEMNASVKCLNDCNCGSYCQTTAQENCRASCLATERLDTSPCKTVINSTCDNLCMGKTSFTSCNDLCMANC